MHIFRWDLDKTYLDTDIESVRGLIRAGLQRANEKRNVPGSRSLLRALTEHDPDSRVFVLSGSPTQMRAVLAEKLKLDGIEVHEIVLKNNLRNLRRGRLRAVRDQLGYKLSQLLAARARSPADATETLFGDDSEVDALVYAAYAAVVRGELDNTGLRRLLQAGKVYSDVLDAALQSARAIRSFDAVQDMFIHLDRGVPTQRFDLLGPGVWPIFSWLQAALRLHQHGRLSTGDAAQIVKDCADEALLTPLRVANLCQDAVRRNLANPASVLDVLGEDHLEVFRSPVEQALKHLGNTRSPAPPPDPKYLQFLRG